MEDNRQIEIKGCEVEKNQKSAKRRETYTETENLVPECGYVTVKIHNDPVGVRLRVYCNRYDINVTMFVEKIVEEYLNEHENDDLKDIPNEDLKNSIIKQRQDHLEFVKKHYKEKHDSSKT